MLPATAVLAPPAATRVLPTRDRFIDLLRLGAMALVVLQHWLMPVLTLEGDVLHTDNAFAADWRSEEHTSELQSRGHLVCRLLLEKKKKKKKITRNIISNSHELNTQ